MDNSDTAEYRAFQSCFDRLVNGVKNDVESVATKAFTNNLISQENQRNATNQHHNESLRTNNLLGQILTKVEQSPACFDTFVAILEEIASLKELARELTFKRAKQTGFNLCQPGKPIASDVTQDTITLEWEKPEHVSERVNFYFVRYQSSENKWIYLMTDSNDTKLTITNLSPQTKYIFKVRPELEDGETGAWSEDSDPIETKPLPCQPGKPTASAVTHDSITVEWSQPEHNSESVESYLMRCRSVNDESNNWKKEVTNENETKLTVANLEPQSEYIFKVRPELDNGKVGIESEISDPIKTKANPPRRPVATKVTHDSISLRWDPPQFNCENIDCYKISYCKCSSQNSSDEWTYEKSKTTTTTISSLSYNTEYVFKVRPVRKNGELGCESPCSEPINTRPASPPGKPAATNVTHNSITLSWSKPRYGAENGTNYLILQCNTHPLSTEEWKELKTSSMSTNVEIKELYSSSNYLFKVKLVCQTGESDESEVSDPIRTKSVCKPGKPGAVKITQNSITLEWKVPEQISESVKEYTIKYTRNDKANLDRELTQMMKAQPQSQPQSDSFKTDPHTIISNLSSGTGYRFTVVPSGDDIHCEYLESEVSDVIVTTVTPPPGRPQLEDVTHDTAMVKWTHPRQGRERMLYYTVCYRLADDPCSDWKECNTSGLQTYKVVSELLTKTKYTFKVVPKCKDGMEGTESEASNNIVTMATSPPGLPVATEVTHEQISLKWTPTEIGRESISSYAVYYRQLEVKQWKFITTTDTTHITIRRLKINEHYLFKVKANCKPGCGDGGESKSSEPVLTKCCLTGRPRATAVSHNSVQLVWDKPRYEYGNITSYEVHYQVGRESDTWHETRAVGRQESIVINSLTPNTEHIFKVRPICEGTDVQTLFCTSDYIKTEDKPPVKCRGKPSAIAITEDSITLQWEKPEDDSESVESYIVRYCSTCTVDHKWKHINMTESDDTKLTIAELFPQTKYIFKVQPELKDGSVVAWSEESDPIKTKAPVSHALLGKPIATDITNDSITIQWKGPETDSQCFTVLYCPVDDATKQWNSITLNTVGGNATVRGLASDTQYIFRVCASGNGPSSELSDPIKTRAISPPGKPTASDVTHNSVLLKWNKPEYGSEKITSYKILYSSTSADIHDEKLKELEAKSNQANILVEDLSVNTAYTFQVQPICSENLGCTSATSEAIKTKPTSPPGKPQAESVFHNSVTLIWTRPEYGRENTKFYAIKVECEGTFHEELEFKTVTEGAQETVTVPHLDMKKKYQFKVRPECGEAGVGMESEMSDVIETMATSPPGKPTVGEVTHESVSLKWTEPEEKCVDIIGYKVRYRKTDGDWRTVLTTMSIVKIKVLDLATQYVFKVAPLCEGAEGNESEVSETIKTKPTSLPGKPHAKSVYHNGVTLVWTKPKYGSENIKYYTVKVECNYEQGVLNELKTEGAQETITVTHLDMKKKYQFKVRPECGEAGAGMESEMSDVIETMATSPPGKPTVGEVTHESVCLQWTEPEEKCGNIEGYEVWYRKTDTNDWKTVLSNGTKLHKTIINQKSMDTSSTKHIMDYNFEYVFKVIPKCINGKGNDSEISEPVRNLTTTPPGELHTHSSVQLEWTKPKYGTEESLEVKNLQPETSYCFKIQPVCSGGYYGTESKTSDMITTMPVCKPTGLTASNTTHESITLTWNRPKRGSDQISHYTVHYKKGIDSDWWGKQRTYNEENKVIIRKLSNSTEYIFKVWPQLNNNLYLSADFTDSILVMTRPVPLAICKYKEAHSKRLLISKGPPPVYELPGVTYTMRDEEKKIAKCHFGDPELGRGKQERVLMLVGATGAGKSTLIECMVNYILGVKWEYDFRFKLINEEAKSHTETQTRFITAYTFYPVEGSALDYTLTIIDTPGYGDTRGIEHDAALTQQIKQFFSTPPPHGIDHIDGIGFVTWAGLRRLTPTQRYIFDSILRIFGEDMKNNIFLMLTFSDAQRPGVLEAIRAANVPNVGYFKFNNSALYDDNSDTDDYFTIHFWKMGFVALLKFFDDFKKMKSKSLQQTKVVLEEREQLEVFVEGLQRQISSSLDIIRELQQDREAIMAQKNNVNVLYLIKKAQESINKIDRIALKKSDPSRDSSSQVAHIEQLIEAERRGGKSGCKQRIEALKILKERAQIVVEVAKTMRSRTM